MKANKVFYGLLASGLALAGLTQSCVSDEPFANGKGEGTLRMQLAVNANLTRAEFESDSLRTNCVLYISGSEGLLYKYKGLETVPEKINMRSGNYIAEAWTGDSVPASFDKRFFKGMKRFEITQGNETSVVVTCRVANVVVSINPATIQEDYMKDWKITVSNSTGSLEFNETNMDYAMGYFMMPNRDIKVNEEGIAQRDGEGWPLYTNLKYRIEGKTASGTDFVKEGLIEGNKKNGIVEHAHNYILNLAYNPEYEDQGGAFITVTVNDYEEVVEETVGLYSRPAIKGVGFDLETLQKGTEGNFKDHIVKVSGFGSIAQIVLSSKDFAAMNLPSQTIDLMNIAPSAKSALEDLGIKWETSYNEQRNLASCYITFSAEFLNGIPQRDGEAYAINILAKDQYGKQSAADFRLGVGEVEEDPVVASPAPSDLLSIRARRAVLSVTVAEDAEEAGIEYRIQNSASNWKFAPAVLTRGGSVAAISLTDLTPGSVYEYRAVAKDFKSNEIYTFTTESEFVIPNAGMEDWSTYGSKNVALPNANSVKSFWDTGNEGSSMLGTNNVTESSDIAHSGLHSAKLQTKMIVGIALAAGNLFAGEFLKVNGTKGASLTFGRPYTGASHPDALSVWVNYNPAQVSKAGQGLTTSQKDHGQIFIAFANGPVNLETDKGILFDPNASNILGYGEKTWEGVPCGAGNEFENVKIPITWYDAAKTVKPTHIIIVCSASKYGDYFVGGNGSVMYVDDFELVY